MLWAVDQDTPSQNLTRTLLSMYRTCPQDGLWPYTTAGGAAELDCPAGALVPGATQTRACDANGDWQVPDVSACNGPNVEDYAAQVCVPS